MMKTLIETSLFNLFVSYITRDSKEFKEATEWIKRTGKAVEDATARIRPMIADEN